VLHVHRLRELRIAVEQRRAVERRVQPLVRIDDERVDRSIPTNAPRAEVARRVRRRRTRRRRAIQSFRSSQIRAMPARSSTMARIGAPRVGDHRADGLRVWRRVERRAERFAGEAIPHEWYEERIDASNRIVLRTDELRVVGDGELQTAARIAEPASTGFARDGEGRAVGQPIPPCTKVRPRAPACRPARR